jgi:hypothetical protein
LELFNYCNFSITQVQKIVKKRYLERDHYAMAKN